MWALLVVEGRKGLTRLARCAVFPQRARSSWERCLAEHRWSLTALTERLGTLVGTQLGDPLHVHGASWLGTDPTLGAKTPQRMLGVQKWQDHSDTADRGASRVGHHWHLVGRRSPWESRWRCWPLGRRWVPGLTGARPWMVGDTAALMRVWDAASATILEGTRCVGDASGRVVAAASDAKAPFVGGLLARGLQVSRRRRTDAGSWDEPAPPAPGKRGRQPREGRQGPLASLLTAQTPPRERLPLDGKLPEGGFVVRDVWRREVAQQGRGVGREGAQEPIILVSPDRARSALQIIDL